MQNSCLGCFSSKGKIFIRQKKKLFGCPLPPAPNFWKLEESFYCTKVYALNFQNSKKRLFFFFENFDLLKIFFKLLCSTFLHFNTGFKLVLKILFGKVDLLAHLLGDIEAIIPCSFSFDFDLEKKILKKKKKNPPACPFSKKVVEGNQTIIF